MGVGGLIFWMGISLIVMALAILSLLCILIKRTPPYDGKGERPTVHPTWLFDDPDGSVYGGGHHRQGQGR